MDRKNYGRRASFIIIASIYIFAIVAGVGVYLALPFHFAINLLLADIAATALVFAFSLIFNNASVYDPYWSVQPPIIVTAFALYYGLNPAGVCLIVAVWLWGARLTANWAYTFQGLSHQDWRYTMLRKKTGAFYPIINFLGIHLVPTVVVYGCTLPVVFAIVYGYKLNFLCIVFCLLSVFATSIQCASDIQMHKFRKDRDSAFIRTGLWKYSRHPNYLGEILMWWGIGLSVLAISNSLLLVVGALGNTFLFLFVSIPLADGRQSKKDGWQKYKRSTRMLLPIYKKQ